MGRYTKILAFLLALFLLISACEGAEETEEEVHAAPTLAAALVREYIAQNGAVSFCFSPLAAYRAQYTRGAEDICIPSEDSRRFSRLFSAYAGSWSLRELFPAYTVSEDFRPDGGSSMTADFLRQETASQCRVAEGSGYTAVSLPLEDGGSVRLILPDKGLRLAELPFDEALAADDAMPFSMVPCRVSFPVIRWEGTVRLPADALAADRKGESYIQTLSLTVGFAGVNTSDRGTGQYYGEQYTEYLNLVFDRPFLYRIEDAQGAVRYVGIYAEP